MPIYDLTGDPFAGIIVTKEKDLRKELMVKTKSIKELEDIFLYGFDFDAPKHYILLGGSGAGKSTALYYIKQYIEENAPKNTIITHTHRGESFILPRDIKPIFGEKDPKDKNQRILMARHDWTNWQETIKDLVKDKKIFIFWDYPDKISTGIELKSTLQNMEELIKHNYFNVFISMNKNNYDTALKNSNLPGKFRKIEIKRFDIDETHNLLYKRLSYYRDPNSNLTDVEPFKDVMGPLRDAGVGVPRTILTTADIILKGAHKRGIKSLRPQDIKTILKDAEYHKKIINDRVDDPNKAETLYMLVLAIRDQFNGEVKKQKDIVDYMKERHGWSNITTVKRLRIIQDYGLLDVRTADDFWTKQYKLI